MTNLSEPPSTAGIATCPICAASVHFGNIPTIELQHRLKELAANEDPSLMASCGAQIPVIVGVLEQRSAAARKSSTAPNDLPSLVPARTEYNAASALQKIHDFEVFCSTTKSERWEQLRTEYARRVLDGEDVQPVIEAAVIAKGGYSREDGLVRLVHRLVSPRLRDNPVKPDVAPARLRRGRPRLTENRHPEVEPYLDSLGFIDGKPATILQFCLVSGSADDTLFGLWRQGDTERCTSAHAMEFERTLKLSREEFIKRLEQAEIRLR
jgi:hypothetical protein